jgi:hypothetical protein
MNSLSNLKQRHAPFTSAELGCEYPPNGKVAPKEILWNSLVGRIQSLELNKCGRGLRTPLETGDSGE